MKRPFDIVAAAISLVVAVPVIAGCCVVSTVVYRAPPLFIQTRVGQRKRPFRMAKVRSLPVEIPDDADKYTIDGVVNHPWGRWIRSLHLDELPQLWSVVAGSMSLVGPRPEMPRLAANYEAAFAVERTLVRPGCTGLWQISTASVGLIHEHPEFDLHYVRHRTFRLDLWILWMTARMAAFRTAISSLDEIPGWTGAGTHRHPVVGHG